NRPGGPAPRGFAVGGGMGAHLKNVLRQDRLVRVYALGQLCLPKLVEMVGWHGGFDAVWFDQEHVGLGIPQIEGCSRAAGVASLSIGAADLSQSMGLPGEWEHPRVWQAVERVARACATARVPWAILPLSPAHARRCVDLGCRMLSLGVDVWSFQRGLRSFQ